VIELRRKWVGQANALETSLKIQTGLDELGRQFHQTQINTLGRCVADLDSGAPLEVLCRQWRQQLLGVRVKAAASEAEGKIPTVLIAEEGLLTHCYLDVYELAHASSAKLQKWAARMLEILALAEASRTAGDEANLSIAWVVAGFTTQEFLDDVTEMLTQLVEET
jgi:hypothetical protein